MGMEQLNWPDMNRPRWVQNDCHDLTSFAGKEAADPLGIEYVDCAGVLGACDDGKADVAGTIKGLNIAVEELAVDSPAVWFSLL